MLGCIRHILDGRIHLSEIASSRILRSNTRQTEKGSRFGFELLSEREFEICEMLAQGRTTNEIATQLGLSVRPVIVHCANIPRKLTVKHASELVAYAVRWMQSGGRP